MYLYKISEIHYDIQRIKQFSTWVTFLFLSLVIHNYFLIIYEDTYSHRYSQYFYLQKLRNLCVNCL